MPFSSNVLEKGRDARRNPREKKKRGGEVSLLLLFCMSQMKLKTAAEGEQASAEPGPRATARSLACSPLSSAALQSASPPHVKIKQLRRIKKPQPDQPTKQ